MGVPYRDDEVDRPSAASEGTGEWLKLCEVADREIREGIDSLLARPLREDFDVGKPFSVSSCLLAATGKAPSEVLTRVLGVVRLLVELDGVNVYVLPSSLLPIEA